MKNEDNSRCTFYFEILDDGYVSDEFDDYGECLHAAQETAMEYARDNDKSIHYAVVECDEDSENQVYEDYASF